MSPRDPGLFKLAQNLVRRFARVPRPIDLGLVGESREFAELYRHVESAGLVEKFGFSKSDSSGKPVPNDASDLLRTYISSFLGDCLGDPSDPSTGFRRFYRALEESLYADGSTWVFLAPLLNFKATTVNIELLPDVQIRRLSNDERNKLAEMLSSMVPGQQLGHDAAYCLTVTEARPKGAPFIGPGSEMFFAPLTALRLAKTGDVGVGSPTTRDVMVGLSRVEGPPYGTIAPPGQLAGSGMAVRGGGTAFRLWRADHDLVAELTRRLQAGVARNVQTALERFNFSYERREATDRIIDYWVALEALFLPGVQDELSYRVALRVAYFVAMSAKERSRLHAQAKKSYDARSWLVHGRQETRKAKKSPFDFEGIARETGEMVRRALRLGVLYQGEPDTERLDAAIVTGKRYILAAS